MLILPFTDYFTHIKVDVVSLHFDKSMVQQNLIRYNRKASI